MPSKVFISYRRDDAKWQAREIYRALTAVLPQDHVFMDIDSIPPGADFVQILEGWVEQCDILLALIGKDWIDTLDPKSGKRRLENPQDFVRIEVRKALARGVPVVPVLLDGAAMPDVGRLPNDLKGLVRRNAEFVVHRTVDADVGRLIAKLGLAEGRGKRPKLGYGMPVALALLLAVGGAGWLKRAYLEKQYYWFTEVRPHILTPAQERSLAPQQSFRECVEDCPEMVVVPAGEFEMGSREGAGMPNERPQHAVTIKAPFAVSKFEATFADWDACVSFGSCRQVDDDGWGRERRPVINVSWDDAKQYVDWLSRLTGKSYRLLSEAEWEYAARANSRTAYSFGDDPAQLAQYAWYSADPEGLTHAVGGKKANAFGLYDMHGNVWEWVEDCYRENYDGVPNDGTAFLSGDCSERVGRGGSWYSDPEKLRSAMRGWNATGYRDNQLGFRVARTLAP
jgi:formylglycine-generating enzyme required for sulfatase activity